MLVADFVFWPAMAILIGSSIYFAPRIASDRIAMQWGFDGKPTWSAPKVIGLWAMVVFALGVRALIGAASTYTPNQVHGAEAAVAIIPIILVASHLYVLRKAERDSGATN